MSEIGFCCPALDLFHCLPLWKTEILFVFHRGRQWKSSRAGQQRPFSDLNFKFQVFSTPGFRFSTWQKKSDAGWKKPLLCNKKYECHLELDFKVWHRNQPTNLISDYLWIVNFLNNMAIDKLHLPTSTHNLDWMIDIKLSYSKDVNIVVPFTSSYSKFEWAENAAFKLALIRWMSHLNTPILT